jgi:acyl-CoA thioester hydrolase
MNIEYRSAPSEQAECAIRDKVNGCLVTLAQVNQLPLYYHETIPDDYIDAMGHMNVRWYMALFDNATWHFFEALGLNQDYFKRCHAGGFALRQFINYWSEVQAGHRVAVRTRILGRSEKRFHFMHFLIDETSGQIAAALESLGTHADLKMRKSSPLPPSIAATFDAHLEKDLQLEWEAPTCGVISV